MGHGTFDNCSRRRFATGLGLAGAAALLGPVARRAAAEPPPETTRLRLSLHRPACWAPQYVAEELLRAEGFTDIEYVRAPGGKILDKMIRSGEINLTPGFSGRQVKGVKPGDASVFLAGLHAGCYSVIARDGIRSLHDLKGKTIRVADAPQAGPHVFFSAIAAYVGLDPVEDFNYLWISKAESFKAFDDGRVDAFMSFAPEPQELRARKVGNVLVDTNVDRPWSQYFCCLIVGNRDFVAKNPVATKRALRAILLANDICARDPERAAATLIEKKARKPAEYDYIVQAMKDIPYDSWRENNPEDTIRFYALRLHELGMIESSPQEIIARNTDWRFLRELKDELNIRL
jgi:NitT/TauT family transport system substrate-binding protein